MSELPAGARRAFVEELFMHYQAGRRPALRRVAGWVSEHQDDHDLRGTASSETVRRTLRGKTIPSWETVETILAALCGIAGRNIDGARWSDDNYGPDEGHTFRTELERRWNAALDEDGSAQSQAPWSDEPPF